MKLYKVFFITIAIIGCSDIPLSEYNELKQEFQEVHIKSTHQQFTIDSLISEINYLKHGSPKLLGQIIQLREEESWDKVLVVYDELRENFPGSNETIKASQIAVEAKDHVAWDKASSRNNISDYKDYMSNFESGIHVQQASDAIDRITQERFAARLKEAKSKNNSYTWKRFLEDYPNYERKRWVENKIIQLEVNEIFADNNTGKLPSSQRLGSFGAGSSKVQIQNNTPYSLVIRYYGPNTRKITIKPRGISNLSLTSGSYKVAASAGGLNYAGVESISGKYSVTYYISNY